MSREHIQEVSFYTFGEPVPQVDTYSHVDTDLLYEGDEKPFHVTLPIAEVGRVSSNGLLYDEELVNSIAEQLKQGIGGIRGHLKNSELGTIFPVDAVNWIGSKLINGTLFAKAYVSDPATREDLRRKKAVGGGCGTSIFGDAIKETIAAPVNGQKAWRARSFKLEQLDLAPMSRAALQMGGDFVITRETQDLNEQETIMQEMRQYSAINGTLRVSLLPTDDSTALLQQLTDALREVATKFGALTTFSVSIEEAHDNTITEMRDQTSDVMEGYRSLTPAQQEQRLNDIKERFNIPVRETQNAHKPAQSLAFWPILTDEGKDSAIADLKKRWGI